jgi:hypothetical protein
MELPHSPLDMLRNLKTAFDHGLVAAVEFYTDDSLKLVSGGRIVERYDTPPVGLGVSVLDFQETAGIPLLTAQGFPVMQYRLMHKVSSTGNVVVYGHIAFQEFADRGLGFERVEAVFGKNWIDHPMLPAPPNWNPPQRTHPRGNGRIRYLGVGAEFSCETVLWLYPDGSLKNCKIKLEANDSRPERGNG